MEKRYDNESANPASLSQELPTALFGFDKEAVIYHIGNIYRGAAAKERRLSASIQELTRKNSQLLASIASYESKLRSMQSQLDAEYARAEELQSREALFNEAIDTLKQKVASLENDNHRSSQEKVTLEEKVVKSRQIIDQLRAKLSAGDIELADMKIKLQQKDIESQKLADAAASAAELVGEKDKEIRRRDEAIAYYSDGVKKRDESLAAAGNAIAAKDNEIDELRRRSASLETRIRELESQRSELVSAIDDARQRAAVPEVRVPETPAPEPKPAAYYDEMEQRLMRQIEYYSGQADKLRSELERFGRQIERFERDIYSRIPSPATYAPPAPAYGQPPSYQPQFPQYSAPMPPYVVPQRPMQPNPPRGPKPAPGYHPGGYNPYRR